MKKRLLLLLFAPAVLLLLEACADKLFFIPSICTSAEKQAELRNWATAHYGLTWQTEDSLLCATAQAKNIHLDYSANLVFAGDLLAIRAVPSRRAGAIALNQRLRTFVLDNRNHLASYDFTALVYTLLEQYPSIGLAAAPLVAMLPTGSGDLFTSKDIAMALWYFDRNLATLGNGGQAQ